MPNETTPARSPRPPFLALAARSTVKTPLRLLDGESGIRQVATASIRRLNLGLAYAFQTFAGGHTDMRRRAIEAARNGERTCMQFIKTCSAKRNFLFSEAAREMVDVRFLIKFSSEAPPG